METSSASEVAAPLTSSGRMLKTTEGRTRSLSEERAQFIEEEYDVGVRGTYHGQFLSNEIATWLSNVSGKEISADIVNALYDGIVALVYRCEIDAVRDCRKTDEFHSY